MSERGMFYAEQRGFDGAPKAVIYHGCIPPTHKSKLSNIQPIPDDKKGWSLAKLETHFSQKDADTLD